MNNAIWGMLNETEKALLREVEPKRLNKLDEDGLANLHDLIRRARDKNHGRGAPKRCRMRGPIRASSTKLTRESDFP